MPKPVLAFSGCDIPENIPDKSPSKLLIANRGEIACRVALTARCMGIVSVAVYSAVDSNALHVQQCDEAIALGGVSAAESYLDIAKILLAAKRCGAHMIHPSYGFLSENAEFAERCHAAGFIFIGPAAESIRIMGSKSAARQAVEMRELRYYSAMMRCDKMRRICNNKRMKSVIRC